MTSHASDSKATACDAWNLCRILYFSTMQCSCCCSSRVRDNQPPGTIDRPAFILSHFGTKQRRSEPDWLQSSVLIDGFKQSVTNDATVAQTSLCWYSCESRIFWAFNWIPYNAYFILPIIFVNFVNNKQELLCYMQENFASFGLLCFTRQWSNTLKVWRDMKWILLQIS